MPPLEPGPAGPLPPLMDDSSAGSPTNTIPARVYELVAPVTASTLQSEVVHINALVTIPDFNRFYHTDPASFEPLYSALDDGSLLASPFLSDIRATCISLVIISVLLTIFSRNIYTSAAFILGSKVRKKGLLYTLFVSQLLAPMALIPLLTAMFQRVISCKAVMLLVVASAGISLSLLMTGVLGVKAYRCLDNSRLVLVVLLILRTAAVAFLVSDLASLQSFRSLSGRCCLINDRFLLAFIILLLVESFFVCLCFLYTVWKSHRSVAARGRIAISLSLDDIVEPPVESRAQSMETSHSRWGWWDYISTADPPSLFSSGSRRTVSVGSYDPSVLTGNRDGVKRFGSGERVFHARPIPLLPLDYTSSPRTSTVRMSTTIQTFPNPLRECDPPVPRRPSSPALSSMSRLSRYIPRLSLFREVMKDELFHTTFMTAFTVVSVVMTLLGVHNGSETSQIGWVGIDWALISCLVIHSFGRAIRRHKYEALLQQPNVWHHNLYTDRSSADLLGEERTRAPRSPFGRTSQPRIRHPALTTRRHDSGHSLCDSSTRRIFPLSPISGGADTRSATGSLVGSSSLLSPVHEVESLTRTHAIPTDQLTDHSNSPKNTGENIFRHDNSLPSLPRIDPSDDQTFSFQTH